MRILLLILLFPLCAFAQDTTKVFSNVSELRWYLPPSPNSSRMIRLYSLRDTLRVETSVSGDSAIRHIVESMRKARNERDKRLEAENKILEEMIARDRVLLKKYKDFTDELAAIIKSLLKTE